MSAFSYTSRYGNQVDCSALVESHGAERVAADCRDLSRKFAMLRAIDAYKSAGYSKEEVRDIFAKMLRDS